MAEQSQFKYLFTPLKIGPVVIRNRLMITAHGTGYVDPNPNIGHPGLYGERYAYYLAERAKGGVGLITFGEAKVHPTSAYEVPSCMSTSWQKEAVPGMRMAVEMIHQAGAKVFIQLAHCGAHVEGTISKLPAWSSSSMPGLGAMMSREMPKAMEKEDIEELIEYYGLSAENAVEAGFDGIELHGGTSYLLHQFHSPLWNKRTDEYGGSLENRMRFTMQVIDKVKSVINDRLALGFRLTVEDFMPGGLDMDDLKEIGRRIEDTGKIDYFNVNPSFHAGALGFPMYDPHRVLLPYSAALKETVSIPVVANLRIVDPREGEKALADGHADIIGITRGHIVDPEIANKAKEGRVDEIRLCTGCCQLCIGNIVHHIPIDCTQNPATGREKVWGIGTMKSTARKKRVIVIGGGVGGMEAAWVAAARGHDVTLYEKSQELGGQVNLAARLPGRSESEEWARWRKVMVGKYGVKVVLGKEMTAEEILKENPEAVVVATGSTPLRNGFQGVTGYPIPGWENPNVMVVDDILEGQKVTTDKVVILDEEAHIKGVGIADMLASQGKQVEIVDRHFMMGNDLEGTTKARVHQIMAERGVKFTPCNFVASIEKDKVTIINVFTQAPRVVEGPVTVILITGRKANEELYFALKGKVKELYRVGDCVAPRLVGAAIYDGHKVGREL
jgi:mycofactocin system FadH/OYE family oxidoreductase 2